MVSGIAGSVTDRRSAVCSNDPSIVELTEGLVAGDEMAFRRFHEQYFDRLYRYHLVMSGGNEQASLDLVQETLLRVVRHAKRFDDEKVLWSWLTVLARSAARDNARRQKSYLRVLREFAQGWFGKRGVPEVEADANTDRELQACLDAALAGLEVMDRQLVEGKYLERKTVKDLALEYGVTPKAVESRLLRARKALKSHILTLLDDERSG